MAGLDPGIHPLSSQEDGWPGLKPSHDRESVVDSPPKAVNPRKNP
jgi:hypothetical protein